MKTDPHHPDQRRWWRALLPWVVPCGLLLAWQVWVRAGHVPASKVPAPSDVFAAAVRLARSGELFVHVAESTKRAAVGFVLGTALGFVLGWLNGAVGWAEELLDSSLQMLRNVPHLALIPLVILWFGIGEHAKQFLIVTGVFFPVYLNTFHGVRSVDPRLREMGRVYGLSRWRLFWDVGLPGALPSILVGLRFALGITWLTLIVAETIAADSGIGYMTMNARDFLQTDVVLLGILLYALLGKLADSVARALERWLLRWNPAYRSA